MPVSQSGSTNQLPLSLERVFILKSATVLLLSCVHMPLPVLTFFLNNSQVIAEKQLMLSHFFLSSLFFLTRPIKLNQYGHTVNLLVATSAYSIVQGYRTDPNPLHNEPITGMGTGSTCSGSISSHTSYSVQSLYNFQETQGNVPNSVMV